MLLKNRCFKYRFRNEIKNHVFSHTEENICKDKRPSSLRLKKKMVRGEKKKKHRFPKLPKSHTDTGRLQMPFMKECTTNISIYSFWIFLANDKRLSSPASLLFTFCLHYTFKHLSKLTKVVCIHAQLENILNLFKPEMHYQKCINIVHY